MFDATFWCARSACLISQNQIEVWRAKFEKSGSHKSNLEKVFEKSGSLRCANQARQSQIWRQNCSNKYGLNYWSWYPLTKCSANEATVHCPASWQIWSNFAPQHLHKKAHRARGRARHIHNVHAVSSLREQAEGQQFTADKGAPRFISSLQNTKKKWAYRLNRQRRRK